MTDARVLVVTSPAKIGENWGGYLQSAGYGVCGLATSTPEALRQIGETQPDLVLVELNGSDELDGIAVAREIGSRHALPVLYVVHLASEELFRQALASKPDGFVFDLARAPELHASIELARFHHRSRLGVLDKNDAMQHFNEELAVAREELQLHIEELQVAEEELRAQNEELLTAEQKLTTERQRYLDLFEFAPDAYLVTDSAGLIVEANRAAGQLFGREARRLLHKPLVLFVAASERDIFFQKINAALHSEEPIHWEMGLVADKGATFQAALTVAGKRVASERPSGLVTLRWLVRDVSQQVAARLERERLLQENRSQREFLERLVQAAPVAIGVVNGPEHRLEMWNATFDALPIFAGRTVQGEPMGDLFRTANPAIPRLLDEVYRTGTVVRLREQEVYAGPGCEPAMCYWDVDGVPLKGPGGQVDRLVVLINPVTGWVSARRQIEELAARAEQRAEELDAVFAAMRDVVVVYDADGWVTRANAAALDFYGADLVDQKHSDVVRRLAIRALDGRTPEPRELPVARALRGEAVPAQQLIFRDQAGGDHLTRASAAPVRLGGQTVGAVATFHDITEEVGIAEARDRLVAILEATPDMVFISSPDGKLLYMNAAARRVRGLGEDESLEGQSYRDMLAATAAAVVEEVGIPTAIRDGIWRGQAAIAGADGTDIPVSNVIVAHRTPGGQLEYLSSIARDVTERQRMIAELAEERARLRAVIDNAPEGIVLADADGRVLLANPAAERLYARPVADGDEYESLASLGLRHPDGSPFDPRHLVVTRSVLDGESLTDAPLRITWPSGQERDLMASSAAIRDDRGRISGSVTIFRDVTEQVRTEEDLRRFSDRLRILYDIDQAILAAQTPEEILPPVLERLARLIPCCYAGMLMDTQAGQLQLWLGDESGEHQVVDSVGLTVADLAAHRMRQVGNLQSVTFPSPVEKLLRDRGLRAYAGAPVLAGSQLLGFLFIGSDEPHGLHSQSMDIVGEVARSLALAIQHDLLRAELVRHSDQLAASLREKDLMLQEIHHRVKNNLQIISSLLDMEATGFQDPIVVQALQDSRNRVKIMALIHERLYQSSEVGNVPAPGYVRTIVSYLFGVYRSASGPVDLDLKVEDVLLDINTAIPLGLILNELVSNALKYAFAGEQQVRGRIRVVLRHDGDRMLLEVSDSGRGLPEEVNWQAPRTLGLRLVKVLAEQLRGNVELDRHDGTTFRIGFS